MNEIINYFQSLGYDTNDASFKEGMKFIECAKNPEKVSKRIKIVEKIQPYLDKMFCGDLVSNVDAFELIRLIKDYHSGNSETNRMTVNDLEITDDVPVKRFQLGSFESLEIATWGLREGLYLIGADSQVGKTAMLIQIAMDVLFYNPDSVVYFFTLDDRIKKFKGRVVSCMSGYSGGETVDTDFALTRYTGFRNRIPYLDKEVARKRDESIEILKDWVKKERLRIYDGNYTAEKIEMELEGIDQSRSIILVDASYRVKTAGRDRMDREENLVVFLKSLSNELLCPLFAIKEIKKGDSRGSGTNKDTGKRKRSGYSGDDIRGSVLWDYEPDVQIILEKQGTVDKPYTNLIRMKLDKNKIRGMEIMAELELQWKRNIYKEVRNERID